MFKNAPRMLLWCVLPHCKPNIVYRIDINGNTEHLLGSTIQPGLLKFNQQNPLEWLQVGTELGDIALFSSMLG